MFEQDGQLKQYGVGTDEFRPGDFALRCLSEEESSMNSNTAMQQIVLDYANTTASERKFIQDLLMKFEYKEEPIRTDFVTPDQIASFNATPGKMTLDFSPQRKTMGQLFEKYFSGEFGGGNGEKVKKNDVARFGHLEKSAMENFSKALRTGADRRNATFEYMVICCLYFQVEPHYAITLFHKCVGMDELASYQYLGGALWLFLQDKNYDYELFVKTCCKMLKNDHHLLPGYISGSRYWNEVYDSI